MNSNGYAKLAMDGAAATGIGPAPVPMRFTEQLCADLAGVLNVAQGAVHRLTAYNDRLIGSEPCDVDKNEAKTGGGPVSHQLNDLVAALRRATNQLQAQLNRTETI